ncbi:TolC family protein [Moraxella sp. Tifton1]|uniref:TolC family protein n=1 Tax=Moraxella oculi TaxID=2940516 RepID=A0ABW8UBI7_9GAMM|nr:TolC family protein [Moraxella sp. Tifton1]MCL1623721.1 TolC family protein [Moraxella sp. Tifton1]
MSIKSFSVVLAVLTLSACQTVPKQPVPLPHILNNEPKACLHIDDKLCTSDWWRVFNDATLNDFMREVVIHNHELSVATLNLQKAILSHQKTKDNKKIMVSNTALAGHRAQKSLSTGEIRSSSNFDVSVNASWEVDLWGKLALQQNISDWEMQASRADRRAVFVSLTATAVREYFNLLGIQQKRLENQQALQYQQKQRKFLQSQLKLGLIAPADTLPIEQTINNLKQIANNLAQQEQASLSTLSLLSQIDKKDLQKQLGNQKFPPNLPTDIKHSSMAVINHRPDVQAQMWRLTASLVQQDLIKKNQYPTLVFTAGAGSQHTHLLDLLKVPVLNWGISLNIPNLNPKDHQYHLNLAKIDEHIATLNYQDSVYKALSDVQDKLENLENLKQNHQLILKANQLAKKQLAHQQKRHELGFISIRELEESKEHARQAQTAVTDSVINQAQALVSVYQAVGGMVNS